MTWASAPARRVTFASTKVTQNRLPRVVINQVHGAVADLFHVSGVISRRHRMTMAPSSALLAQKISSNTSRSPDQ
jgi:hypothetical protein